MECPKCNRSLSPNLIGDALCKCGHRITFSGEAVIGVKPLDHIPSDEDCDNLDDKENRVMEPADNEIVGYAPIGKLLPEWEEIPEEFKSNSIPPSNKYVELVTEWFFKGLDPSVLVPKEGIDKNQALNHLGAVLISFEPSHEHKTAGVAYLMSQWFDIKED